MLLAYLNNLLGNALLKLGNGVEIHAFFVACRQHDIGLVFEGVGLIKRVFIERKTLCFDQGKQGRLIFMLFKQGKCRRVIYTRGDAHVYFQGCSFGFVF